MPSPPVIYKSPATESSWAGEVDPIPTKPASVIRMASVIVPERMVENARSDLAVLKFWVRIEVMYAVLVALITSLARKVRREAVEVAESRLER